MAEEEWVWIKGMEGRYKISSHGNIQSFVNGKNGFNISFRSDKDGYFYVILRDHVHRKHQYRIHRLVADTFIENPCNLPIVNHIDGNKQNNNTSNLEHCTRSQNDKHAFKLGLRSLKGEKNNFAKLRQHDVIDIYKLAKKNILSQSEIGAMYSISQATVSAIKLGKNWGYLTSGVVV